MPLSDEFMIHFECNIRITHKLYVIKNYRFKDSVFSLDIKWQCIDFMLNLAPKYAVGLLGSKYLGPVPNRPIGKKSLAQPERKLKS